VSSEREDGYVHRPDERDEPGDGDTDEDPDRAPLPGPEPTGFGDRGWVLVATVVLCFLVVPGIIYLRPALPGEAGLSFIVAMLVLPLVPAVLLGLTAVWSMRESRRR
jgi:hypothetical protein